MKAAPLLVAWHESSPVYSAHFEPQGKGRLATAGGDNNVRVWKIDYSGDERKVTYLSTLKKHTQAVNVVRWCPKGELLATAGDDGNVLLWVPSSNPALSASFGDDAEEDVESWRVKTMCRSSSGSEIYDLAWSPDGQFFITGSMDNVARIYDASNGTTVRQIAEHNHYVQGVAWDPLNEFVATQSSDRSVHIYTLRNKEGQFSLSQHNRITKMDLPARRISSSSPAPPDFGNYRASLLAESTSNAVGSPILSAPGTPQSLAAPMNPPPTSHSRRSSFGSQIGPPLRRSVSPSPSIPLPAVMPSASPGLSASIGLGVKNANLYANETFTSFFRRLTFAPDGSLLFTPAGQYKTSQPGAEGSKPTDDIINTVYIYTRSGLNKPPVAHLPGHRKPSVAVKCSPVYYNLRSANVDTKEIAIDTRTEEDIPPLPEPVIPSKAPTSHASMEPPPPTSAASPSPFFAVAASPRMGEADPSPSTPVPPSGPQPAFSLPYRIVYAVATQDAVYVYDTQQTKPLCVVSNLHYATFTDLSWSTDGRTLLMTSSDGFCSALSFAAGELGTVYHPPMSTKRSSTPVPISIAKANSAASTPQATPTAVAAPPPPVPQMPRHGSQQGVGGIPVNPSPSPFSMRPASPARSMSASSIASSFTQPPDQNATPSMNNPTPTLSSIPSVAAAGSNAGAVPLFTPPQTPGQQIATTAGGVGPGTTVGSIAGIKRGSDASAASHGEDGREKRRRVAPTPVNEGESSSLPPPPPPAPAQSQEGN
ncbi:WD40 repeat-like protein [Polychaeton citri CBS 116435]|uniref:WD40 repeat-like protein n=1 Tax=Polychaeton citri CBS 116435 TaxID=1314669 RepID=A0A9P4Q420_9PEZI|nr:WD40 repeat-like protein [Polychaeton citri CBS 116435]